MALQQYILSHVVHTNHASAYDMCDAIINGSIENNDNELSLHPYHHDQRANVNSPLYHTHNFASQNRQDGGTMDIVRVNVFHPETSLCLLFQCEFRRSQHTSRVTCA